jgi:DNA-binding transcriptional regulator YbjK
MATRRGRARAAEIAAATADLLTEQGPHTITHRAVAARAGVPLGSLTYYFSSLEDLLAGGAQVLVDRQLLVAEDVVAGIRGPVPDARPVAGYVVAVLLDRDDDRGVLAYYDQLLAAGRYPRMQRVLRDLRPVLLGLVDQVLDRCGWAGRAPAERILVVVDGTILGALSEGRPGARRQAEEAVAQLLASR